ncbi:amidase signature domain-containing protein [Aspergillus cavernicola]|uniref:amidase n=1 Tax=Aspergillus cavernicola TaxID=176166 RepID=A0ABR4IFZ6_9EURO
MTISQALWEERVFKKRKECFNKIPLEWRVPDDLIYPFKKPLSENKNDFIRANLVPKSGILSARELKITENYTVRELIAELANGTLTSAEVTLAYCKRAAVVQQLVGCLTETMFSEAQERARYLDSLRAQEKLAGPLHGLPVSIKDNFHYKGTEATIGMVTFMDEVSTETSPLVDILLKLGAVIYVKTNVPQTMMTSEAQNNVFGRTLNPWNTAINPGGSSGGEGALIALRGSPLGVGTDIGGSIRIPALCCGTYGFRPSASRVPNGKMRVCNTPGMRFILSVAGPLCLDLEGIELFFETLFATQPALYDSTILDIPWRKVGPLSPKKKLRIGVIPEHPIFPLHPPVRRTLASATALLKAAGHDVISLSTAETLIMELNEVAMNLFGLDLAAISHVVAANEPIAPAILHIGTQVERLKSFYKPTISPDLSGVTDKMEKFAILNARRSDLREKYRALWVKYSLDVCIAPPAQSTAVRHDEFGLAPYTTFLNCLDYPSVVIPFGEVGEVDKGQKFTLGDNQVAPEYDYELLEGAPCAVQLFTTTLRDEECLQISKQVDAYLNGKNRVKVIGRMFPIASSRMGEL